MEPEDWNKPARNYDREVLSVHDADIRGRVKSLIRRQGWKHKSAIDLGCGVGKFLPLLAEQFGVVHACDYSAAMLRRARARCAGLENLSFGSVDLRRGAPAAGPADFVLCVNVLLTPSLAEREAMWRHLAKSVAPGGQVALVVPSLESGLLARHRLLEWNLRSRVAPARAVREGFAPEPTGPEVARSGLLDAGGAKTKHFLAEEIELTCMRHGLKVASCEKVEYRWNTEFAEPPRWMREPYPWDWLALLRAH